MYVQAGTRRHKNEAKSLADIKTEHATKDEIEEVVSGNVVEYDNGIGAMTYHMLNHLVTTMNITNKAFWTIIIG